MIQSLLWGPLYVRMYWPLDRDLKSFELNTIQMTIKHFS